MTLTLLACGSPSDRQTVERALKTKDVAEANCRDSTGDTWACVVRYRTGRREACTVSLQGKRVTGACLDDSPDASKTRVEQTQVLIALQDAASHVKSGPRAVGTGCSPNPGDGISDAWRCRVEYQVAPRAVDYSVKVEDNGCWLATSSRAAAPKFKGCGLPVRPK